MKTEGENIMRTEFNPSNTDTITVIKNKYAELYNIINNEVLESTDFNGEQTTKFCRSKEAALKDLKQSCMWAVNAITVNF